MQIGAQLWLFNAVLDEERMDGILTQLKAADYAFVETLYGKPPAQRAVLDRLSLPCYATHTALSAMPPEEELLAYAHHMKATTVCVSGLLRWHERAADDYRRAAEALNTWGQRLQSAGIALHYHNHDFEFAIVEGAATGMDVLIPRLDTALVPLCFDAGWAMLAGYDPVQFLTEHAARIGTLHLRDFRGAESVALGAGDLNLASLVPLLETLPNLKATLVEQDPGTATPVEDMVASRRFLKKRFGL